MKKILSEHDIPAEPGEKVNWPFEPIVSKGEYAQAMFRLQDEVGLGFREARALLMPSQSLKALAAEWKCSAENVYNLARKGREKVEKYVAGDEDLYAELVPARMCHIF